MTQRFYFGYKLIYDLRFTITGDALIFIILTYIIDINKI
jgi:hypothetical protein